nr:hypothetical protein [Tanacetum cinerariifolium]
MRNAEHGENRGVWMCALKAIMRFYLELDQALESGDLVAYGLIPEFIGRFPILVSSSALNEDQLLQVKLHFTYIALRLIAKKAIAKNTGAKGLRVILENVLVESIFKRKCGYIQCALQDDGSQEATQEKQTMRCNFMGLQAKFVRDFKSLAKEADESLDKQKSLELEIERLLKASVCHDIMSIVQNGFVDVPSDLQTELDRMKEKLKLYIIKKEKEYAVLWNNWYTKCEECKYDKISYDKAYNDMQQKVKRLQAQLRDLKGKSSDTPSASNTLDPLNQKLESKIVELEFQVVNYERTSVTPYVDKPKLSAVTPHSKKLHASIPSHSVPQPREFNVMKHRNRHVTFKENVSSDTVNASSTGLVHTARTRRPHPKGDTRNARVLSASKSSEVKKNVTVKDHCRILLHSKNQKTMSSECNNIKCAIRNDKSKIVCGNCKQCLVTANHGVNALNSRANNMYANVPLVQIKRDIGHSFDLREKLVASKETNCPNDDKACTSNPQEPMRKQFPNSTVFLGRNDHIAAILGYGDLKWGNITTRVYFVEGLGHNLLSVGQFCDADLEVAFRRNTCFIRDLDGVDLLKGNRSINLYTINLYDMASVSPICLIARATPTKSWLWHQQLSYLNFDTINDLAKNDLVFGLPNFKYAKKHLCPSYEQGKSKRASHPPKPVPNSKQWLHLLHMDLYGPIRVASINGKRYVLVIIDDYSRYTWVHFLKTKDETPEVIKNFLKKIYVRLQAPVIIVRTDNGTEFKNHVLKEYFDSVGITHKTFAAKTPQQNGVVECRNRTLVEAARTMLIFSHAPLFLWAEAIATACYTQNHSIIHGRLKKTPYELIQGRKPDISYLHVFGALCYPKNDHEDIGKLSAKGDIGFFIGYYANSVAYRVYNRRTKKIMETMNVTFDELSGMAFEKKSSRPSLQSMTFEQNSSKPGLQSMTSGQISSELELTYAPLTITPQRPSERDLDILFEPFHNEYLGGRPSKVPRTIPTAPVLQNLQAPTASMSIQESAPTPTIARMEAIKIFLAYAAHKGFAVYQMNVKTAVLHGSLKKDMYVCQPKGFIDVDHLSHVYKLKKALYGLKQAPRAWYNELSTFLLQNGFSKGTIDPTLFTRRFNDDILVVNQSPSGIFINQSNYVNEILKKYGLNTCDIIGLWYTKDSGFELTGFSNADYAGCKDTFKSTSVLWMRTQLTDYGYHFDKIPTYCDSKSSIAISCNPVQHSKMKHIAVRYHFTKENVKKGTIELYFVKTDYQLADIFTKELPVDRFNYLVCRLVTMEILLELTSNKLLVDAKPCQGDSLEFYLITDNTVMSDSEDSTVTYTEVSNPFEDLSDIGSPRVDGLPMMPQDSYAYVKAALQASPSPDYVPSPEHPPTPEFVLEPTPISLPSETEVARLLSIPTLPPLSLSLLSSPLPLILSPLPPILSSPLPISFPPLPSSPTYPLGYRAMMIRLRAEAPSTSHPPPPIILPHTRESVAMLRAVAPSTYILAPRSETPPSGTPPLLLIPLPTSSPPLLLLKDM